MALKQEIEKWDEKSSDQILEIYQRYAQEASLAQELIKLLQIVDLQKGASWLIKHHLESGHNFKNAEISGIYKSLNKVGHWEARLHLLQCIPYISIADTDKEKVEIFLRHSLADENKFIRAWAYSGMHDLAIQYPEYEREVKSLFKEAIENEAPSVKARIRKITQEN